MAEFVSREFCENPVQCSAYHELAGTMGEINGKLASIMSVLQLFFRSWKLAEAPKRTDLNPPQPAATEKYQPEVEILSEPLPPAKRRITTLPPVTVPPPAVPRETYRIQTNETVGQGEFIPRQKTTKRQENTGRFERRSVPEFQGNMPVVANAPMIVGLSTFPSTKRTTPVQRNARNIRNDRPTPVSKEKMPHRSKNVPNQSVPPTPTEPINHPNTSGHTDMTGMEVQQIVFKQKNFPLLATMRQVPEARKVEVWSEKLQQTLDIVHSTPGGRDTATWFRRTLEIIYSDEQLAEMCLRRSKRGRADFQYKRLDESVLEKLQEAAALLWGVGENEEEDKRAVMEAFLNTASAFFAEKRYNVRHRKKNQLQTSASTSFDASNFTQPTISTYQDEQTGESPMPIKDEDGNDLMEVDPELWGIRHPPRSDFDSA